MRTTCKELGICEGDECIHCNGESNGAQRQRKEVLSMNQEEVVEKLMNYGLSEVQALEVYFSRNERDLKAILDFLHFYGERISC